MGSAEGSGDQLVDVNRSVVGEGDWFVGGGGGGYFGGWGIECPEGDMVPLVMSSMACDGSRIPLLVVSHLQL